MLTDQRGGRVAAGHAGMVARGQPGRFRCGAGQPHGALSGAFPRRYPGMVVTGATPPYLETAFPSSTRKGTMTSKSAGVNFRRLGRTATRSYLTARQTGELAVAAGNVIAHRMA